jgi:hypothetical protein
MRFSSLALTLGFLGLAAAVAATGCDDGFGDSGPPGGDFGGMGCASESPATLDIDTDQTITTMPGQGVGIFVEYATGGIWTVFTACDTNISGDPCDIDVFAVPVDNSVTIGNVTGVNFQGPDAIEIQQDGTVHMFVETTTGLDGMTFTAMANASIEFEVYLDGALHPEFIYWIGDGVLHTGSPTDPVNFVPKAAPNGPDAGTGGGGTGGSAPDGGGDTDGGTGGSVPEGGSGTDSGAGTGGADAGG